jgi:DNA invertase Pin-like site-specific DNA recombinase
MENFTFQQYIWNINIYPDNFMKRATIYARVSTKDQNVEGQLIDLRGYAQARGLLVIQEYVDVASGSRNDRLNYLKLFNDVRKRNTDVVLVWRFDRFARSTRELIIALEEFNSLDVDFISFKENVDTSTPTGKILFTMISALQYLKGLLFDRELKLGWRKRRAGEC